MGLDLSRASRIYGSSRAAWLQDGRYYTHDGREIPPDLAAEPDPDDPPRKPAPVRIDTVPSYHYEDQTTPITPVTDGYVPGRLDTVLDDLSGNIAGAIAGPSHQTRLRKMPAAKVAELVELAGGTPESGFGSKKKNIAWLLEHTA